MSASLPIFEVIPEIKSALWDSNSAILQAPPGAGKSTVLPLHLLDEPWLRGKKIIMLEPRRLAARAVAWRLAEQLNEEPGGTVGYRIRFENKIGKNTRIEIVTEGILTRMLQQDNSLAETGIVIFDEFHERSLHADLALALCREAQLILRNDLRILIMSATLDGAEISSLLDDAPVITSSGRQFPVAYKYMEPEAGDSIAVNTSRVIGKAFREETGDLLVFLPGSGDIHRVHSLLENVNYDAAIHLLYGDLPHEEQQRALMPDKNGRRKIILSTSIAETSLTIEGIRIVVDSGYSRVPRFDPRTGLTRLETVRSTLDTADQRTGRAGRLGPGICYRNWPERTNQHLVAHRSPEILNADLSQMVLELANWGHTDPSGLTWITTPPSAHISQAVTLLENLGALHSGKITNEGKELLSFPTHPRIAHLLQYGIAHQLSALAADVAAIIEERDPLRPEAGTDLSLRLESLHRWRAKEKVNADRNILERIDRVSKQWRSLAGVKSVDYRYSHEQPGQLIAAAYPERIARREDEHGKYRLANGRIARLPEHDPLTHESWIAIAQLDAGKGEGKIFLAAAYDPAELLQSAKPVESVTWDSRSGSILLQTEWKSGNFVLKKGPLANPDSAQITKVLSDVIRQEGLHLFEWTDHALQLRARVLSLRKWRPDSDIPDFSDDGLFSEIENWAGPFIQKVRRKEDFKKLPLEEMLNSLLSWPQKQLLDKLLPEKITVPSGSAVSLEYSNDGNVPVLAVRLQEVFGLLDTPAINEGRVKVLMHLLSPGYKPVQVTQDLRSFWQNTYAEVRKELRVRYQKHSWPEDPWTAPAIRGVVKKKKT